MQGKYSYYLIRHGHSEQNLMDKSGKGHRPHPDGELIDECLIDAQLTQLGLEQAQTVKDLVKNIDIGLVIVSPLKRALQTAYEIFKDHPSKPLIKVEYEAREILAGASTVPGDLEALRKEFSTFDFSAFDSFEDKEVWLAEAYEDKELKEELRVLKDSVKGEEDRRQAFSRLLLKKMEEISPKNIEKQEVIVKRSREFARKMHEIVTGMNDGKKVCLVAHFTLIKLMYATEFDHRGWAVNGLSLKNCELKEYEFS